MVADIGGGQGTLLKTILEHHAHVRGVLFDLPPVVDRAHPELRNGDARRTREIIGGDCRVAIPVAADVYVLKNVLEWDDESSIATLRNVARARGRVRASW